MNPTRSTAIFLVAIILSPLPSKGACRPKADMHGFLEVASCQFVDHGYRDPKGHLCGLGQASTKEGAEFCDQWEKKSKRDCGVMITGSFTPKYRIRERTTKLEPYLKKSYPPAELEYSKLKLPMNVQLFIKTKDRKYCSSVDAKKIELDLFNYCCESSMRGLAPCTYDLSVYAENLKIQQK